MADDPSVYGKFMNFFLPPSAQVGGPSLVSTTPGLYDMLGVQSGTPEEQQRKRQQQQWAAMGQQGLKMLTPPQMPQMPPPPPDQTRPAPPPPQMPPPPAGYPSGQPTGYGAQGPALPLRPRPMPPRYPFNGGYDR